MYKCKDCGLEYKTKVDYCECGNNSFEFIEDKTVQKFQKKLTLEQKSNIISWSFFVICIILSIIVFCIPISKKILNPAPVKLEQVKDIPSIDKIWNNEPIFQPKKEVQTVAEEVVNTAPKQIITTPQPKTIQKNSKQELKTQPQIPKTLHTPQKQTSTAKVQPKTEQKTVSPKQSPKQELKRVEQKQTKPVEQPSYNPNSSEMLKYKGELRAQLFSKLPVGSIQGAGECDVQFSINSDGKLINRKFSNQSLNKSLNDAVYYMLMSVPRFSKPPVGYNGEIIRMHFYFNNGNYEISIF